MRFVGRVLRIPDYWHPKIAVDWDSSGENANEEDQRRPGKSLSVTIYTS